jgi:uncharacterized protein YecE (DUF72 family)
MREWHLQMQRRLACCVIVQCAGTTYQREQNEDHMRKAAASARGTIRIGVGGWTYEPWRGTFYPEGLTQSRELEFASRKLTSIEINGTYYGPQKPATFAKWRDATPEDFVFSVKAPRFAVNRKELASAGLSIERFLSGGVTELGKKLGPINWQLLPTKQFEPDDFRAFLALLPPEARGLKLRHVVEVRHKSFRTPDFVALLREFGVAAVIAGDSTHPQIVDASAPFVYVRIMGTQATQKLGYSNAALKLWAARVRAWAAGETPAGLDDIAPQEAKPKPAGPKPRDVYLYVISGHKVSNPSAAMALIEQIGV